MRRARLPQHVPKPDDLVLLVFAQIRLPQDLSEILRMPFSYTPEPNPVPIIPSAEPSSRNLTQRAHVAVCCRDQADVKSAQGVLLDALESGAESVETASVLWREWLDIAHRQAWKHLADVANTRRGSA